MARRQNEGASHKLRFRRQLPQHPAAAQLCHRKRRHGQHQIQARAARVRRHHHRKPGRNGVQHPLESCGAAVPKVRLPNRPVKHPAGYEAVLGVHNAQHFAEAPDAGARHLLRDLQHRAGGRGAVAAEGRHLGADGGGGAAQRRLGVAVAAACACACRRGGFVPIF